MMTHELNLKPCPLCGGAPAITLAEEGLHDQRIVIECRRCGLVLDHTQHYYTTERYNKTTGIRVIENTGLVDSESAIDLWNRRTPDLGNEDQLLLDKMFPKCENCKSRPSDYSKTMCMCNEGIYLPKHPPRGQDTHFKIGSYEEMEINE